MIDYHIISVARAAISFPTFSGGIGDFVSQLYNFAIAVVGLAVFVQFLRAGFVYLYAAGNAGQTSHAKEIMQNAVLGAILLLSAYLILNVINPDLVNVGLFQLPSGLPSETIAPGNPKPPTTTVDPKQARILLGNAGITSGGVDLTGITDFTVQQLIYTKQACGGDCPITITGFHSSSSGDTVTIQTNGAFFYFLRVNATPLDGTTLRKGSRFLGNFGITYTYEDNSTWTIRYPHKK